VAGERAVEFIRDGMVVGLGTGSTTYYAIKRLGMMVSEGMDIIGIPTSQKTQKVAVESGITLSTLEEHPKIDVTIDGADEVDPNLDLIKGMGGALLWEKIVASVSEAEIIVVDPSKVVDILGSKSSLPVEVCKFGWKSTNEKLKALGCHSKLRMVKDSAFITDSGNYIIDCSFLPINNPSKLESDINMIPGIVENGLFLGLSDVVIIGNEDGGKLLGKPL
jgi:ribose 5-phosphate isomerase A